MYWYDPGNGFCALGLTGFVQFITVVEFKIISTHTKIKVYTTDEYIQRMYL